MRFRRLHSTAIANLAPGEWIWDGGIGYRRHSRSNGGAWYIKYWAPLPGCYPDGVTTPTRQVKERIPNCRNRSQAEGVLMARKAAIFEGTYQRKRKTRPTTLSDFVPRFLENKRHLRTAAKYRQQFKQHLIPYFRGKPIEAINGQDCLAYYNGRLDSEAAISTVNGEMACLKSFFAEAGRAGLVQTNPVRVSSF
jgi:hypothetical protein